MEQKKRGRKKKFNDLVKANFYIERETYDLLHELARLLNEIKGGDSIRFSDVARRLLEKRGHDLLRALKEEKMSSTESKSTKEQFDWRP